MDIYIAKEHMDKLLSYVQNLADTKPRMYQKSKDRLRDIAQTCQKVVEMVSEILQEEMLDDCFEDNSDSDFKNTEILNMVKCMQSELNNLKQFVQYTPTHVDLDTAKRDIEIMKSSNSLSTLDRKSIMSEYKVTLKNLSESYVEFPQISDLCKLLYTWFDCRFYKSMKVSSNFRYNIRRIPTWICDIVSVYGKSIDNECEKDFIHSFYDWLDNICETGSKFAVPYEIYEFDVDSKKNISMTSVVIWDILLELGLSKLCKFDNSEVYLSEDILYNLCMKHSPNNLDKYRNYKVDRSILSECKLFSEWYEKGGIEND